MPRLHVQAKVREYLEKHLNDVEVRTHVPDPRPKRLVVVRREGGALKNKFLDAPGIGISMWAGTEAETAELAERVSGLMFSLPFQEGFARVDEIVLRSDFDLLARIPRWYGSYTLTTFNPN